MDKQQITDVLKAPKRIAELDTATIDTALAEFPFFNTLHLLAAKKAKLEAHKDESNLLFNAALHTCSRERLFTFIETEEDNLEVEIASKPTKEEIPSGLIESLKGKKKEKETVINTAGTKSPSLEPKENVVLEVKELPNESKIKKDSYFSFTAWLQKVEDEKETKVEKAPEKIDALDESIQAQAYEATLLKTAAVIEEISKKEEKKKPEIKINMDELAKKSASPQEGNITETLAKIFVMQKKYAKAIEAYEFLSLKYPEKSIFFAPKIENLKTKL